MRLYLAGPAGAGKTTVAGLLWLRFGSYHYRLSDLLRRRERMPDRACLQAYGDRLRGELGPAVLAVATHQAVLCDQAAVWRGTDIVIDGVRLPEEADYLRRHGYLGIRVETPAELRQARLAGCRRELAPQEQAHRTERLAEAVPADLVLPNTGDFAELARSLAPALDRLGRHVQVPPRA